VRRVNLSQLEIAFDDDDPDGYHTGYARFGKQLEAKMLGATLYVINPGQSICPYHYEYGNEEWLLVLAGRPMLRDPDGEHQLERDDVVCFPVGPDGAHKVTNRTDEPVRVLFFSTVFEPSVAVYPDSDKIGVWPGDSRDRIMVKRADGNVGYWVGEA
jgi:uncharacterized cupin superfamily protein